MLYSGHFQKNKQTKKQNKTKQNKTKNNTKQKYSEGSDFILFYDKVTYKITRKHVILKSLNLRGTYKQTDRQIWFK